MGKEVLRQQEVLAQASSRSALYVCSDTKNSKNRHCNWLEITFFLKGNIWIWSSLE